MYFSRKRFRSHPEHLENNKAELKKDIEASIRLELGGLR
jgi:hypothetical protein